MLADGVTCVPALTPVLVKGYGETPVDVFFSVRPWEHRTIACSRGMQ